MPLVIDVHHGVPKEVTPEALAALHQKDLAVEGKSGVRYLKYWYDAASGKICCRSDAPSPEAAMAVHREAHGAPAGDYFEIIEGTQALDLARAAPM